jgi:hypothetical protein
MKKKVMTTMKTTVLMITRVRKGHELSVRKANPLLRD